jgi:hypothetical protein
MYWWTKVLAQSPWVVARLRLVEPIDPVIPEARRASGNASEVYWLSTSE